MKYRNFIFLLSIISFFLFIKPAFTLPGPKLCQDQEDYTSEDYKELYCIKCDTTYSKVDFLRSFNQVKMENLQYFTKDELEDFYPDRQTMWCKDEDITKIGIKNLQLPESEINNEPNNVNSNNEDSEESPDTNIDTTKNKSEYNLILNDLELIENIIIIEAIQAVQQYIDNYEEYSKVLNNNDPNSFLDKYIGDVLATIEDSKIKISIKDMEIIKKNLKKFKDKKNEAITIYLKRLGKCGPKDIKAKNNNELNYDAKFSNHKNDKCEKFLKSSADGIINKDRLINVIEFLRFRKGFLDTKNDNVVIIDALIDYWDNQIINAKAEKIQEDTDNQNNIIQIQEEKFIAEIQEYLFKLDFIKNKKDIDGLYGEGTEFAINNWRKKRVGNTNNTGLIEKDSDEFKLLKKHYDKRIDRIERWNEVESTVKELLKFLGYKKIFRNLESQIKAFQKDHNFSETGKFWDKEDTFNEDLYKKLIEENDNRINIQNELNSEVPNIQKYLQLLGYYTGKIDGNNGKGTKNAISKWEANTNNNSLLNNKNEIDQKVLLSLKKEYEILSGDIEKFKEKLNNEINDFKDNEKLLNDKVKEIDNLENHINEFEKKYTKDISLPQLIEIEEIDELNKYLDKLKNLNRLIDDLKKEIELLDKSIQQFNFENINSKYMELRKDINKFNSKFVKNLLHKKYKESLSIKSIELLRTDQSSRLYNFEQNSLNIFKEQVDENINKINNRIEELESNSFIIIIILGIGILLVGGGIGLYLFRNQKNKEKQEQSERELQEKDDKLKREELERENLRLKENIEKQKQIQRQTTQEDEQLTTEQKEIKNTSNMINDYINSIKDVSNIDSFKEKWEAIGLKEDQIIDHSKSRTLSIDIRDFNKANFWAIPWKNEYIIFAGRTLSKNAPALIANDYQWAKELFEGIFEITEGEEFMTKTRALAKRNGDTFIVSEIGVVYIPK